MKFPNMFSPVRIGTVTVPNRFVVPPMGNNFANHQSRSVPKHLPQTY